MGQNITPSEVLVRKLVDMFKELLPGTLVGFPQIMACVDIQERSRVYGLVRRAAKVLMREHGMFLKNERDVGYRIVKPGEEILVCQHHYERGIRAVKRGVVMSNLIRIDELPEAARPETTAIQQRMANHYGLLTA